MTDRTPQLDPINIANIFVEYNEKLSVVGRLYNGNFSENPCPVEKRSIELDKQGYDFSEQIYDLYSYQGYLHNYIEREM